MINVDQKVKAIQIYRDHAEWQYIHEPGDHSAGICHKHLYKMDITADIALKISCEKDTYLFILEDTIAMFIPVYRNYPCDEYEIINKYWSKAEWGMKAENIEVLDRTIIDV